MYHTATSHNRYCKYTIDRRRYYINFRFVWGWCWPVGTQWRPQIHITAVTSKFSKGIFGPSLLLLTVTAWKVWIHDTVVSLFVHDVVLSTAGQTFVKFMLAESLQMIRLTRMLIGENSLAQQVQQHITKRQQDHSLKTGWAGVGTRVSPNKSRRGTSLVMWLVFDTLRT